MRRYCLNFHGRVTVASVKNFQMCYEDNVEPVLLQVTRADALELDLLTPRCSLARRATTSSRWITRTPSTRYRCACSVGGVRFVGAGSACKGAALHHAMIHDCFISRIETLKNDFALGVTRDQAFGVVLSSFDSKLACE